MLLAQLVYVCSLFFFEGEPVFLGREQFRQTLQLSTQDLEDEQSRSTRPSRPSPAFSLAACLAADPDDGPASGDNWVGEDYVEIYKLLPLLGGLSDSLLSKIPLSAALQLNAALQKESKSADKLSINAKLSMNSNKLVKAPLRIEAGNDNRKNVLHPARFLGGACCAKQELWLLARKFLGNKEVVPLGRYDMDSVGCGGCVTPRAWLVIHNPSSQELKLRHFYLPNVGSSGLSAKKVALEDGGDALSIGESMKEIADMDGFRTALNTAREAMATALPWNHSIAAIVGFMMNSNFCQGDLQGVTRKAQVLAEFVDYILGRNALNWENCQPFLSTDELAHVWSMWKGKRVALFSAKMGDKPIKKREFIGPKDICRRFNYGKCNKQSDKECVNSFGTKLRHCCNFVNSAGRACKKDHPRLEHK